MLSALPHPELHPLDRHVNSLVLRSRHRTEVFEEMIEYVDLLCEEWEAVYIEVVRVGGPNDMYEDGESLGIFGIIGDDPAEKAAALKESLRQNLERLLKQPKCG